MILPKQAAAALLVGGMAGVSGQAFAHHSYNPYGYDGTTAGYSLSGNDGGNPSARSTNTGIGSGTWGGPGVNYTGTLQAMWFAAFHSNVETHSLSTAEALTKTWDHDNSNATSGVNLPANFELSVGGKAWEDGNDNSGWGHGMDFGLIRLDKALSNFSVTVAADNSSLLPAFSLYSGWDSGAGSDRHATYVNNANNPLGTSGLTLLAAVANDGDGSVTYDFGPLAVGKYSLFIGGDDFGAGAGKYTVSMSAVPVPGAVWLFGSALAGLIGFGRRKAAIAA